MPAMTKLIAEAIRLLRTLFEREESSIYGFAAEPLIMHPIGPIPLAALGRRWPAALVAATLAEPISVGMTCQ